MRSLCVVRELTLDVGVVHDGPTGVGWGAGLVLLHAVCLRDRVFLPAHVNNEFSGFEKPEP